MQQFTPVYIPAGVPTFHMESAGDVVAVPVLKPVFQYCMAVGTALVLPVLVSMLLGIRLNGRGLALLVMSLMVQVNL